ncbi:MAG: class I SAM-dependent methyltransferase [Actinomycetota bacterium]|nr:class I SAM-dependent methyltransferase [Actinomycetota bacterium]
MEPRPEVAERINAFLAGQLGGVLPPDPARGLDWDYGWVVLGERSLEALRIFAEASLPSERPVVDVGSGLGTFVLLANECGLPAVGIEPGQEELRSRASAPATAT